jgi:hypothetical protein
MADIFNEIDEELRGDQMRRLWSNYSGLIIAVAVLIVVGVAGWRGYEYWSQVTARADGDKYLAAIQLSAKGDYQGAEAALKTVSTSGSAGYRTLAQLRGADELVLAGDPSGAVAAFDAIARDSAVPVLFQNFASIRAAYLALDLDDREKLEARVKPLAVAGNPWRHAAREILAFAAWKAGDSAAAKSWVDQIETDADTPADLTNRITILSAVINGNKKPDLPAPASAAEAPAASSPAPASPATSAPAVSATAPAVPPAASVPAAPTTAAPETTTPAAPAQPAAPTTKAE